MLQHGSYTLLIDSCYDREQFPTLQEAIEWTWASSKEEREAVEFVLTKFFELSQDGRYVQSRIQEDLDSYHANSKTNKRIAEERESKRKEIKTNRERTVNEPPPNHKPLTNNQEPITNKEPPKPPKGGIEIAIKKNAICLQTFLDDCKAKNERPLKNYEPLWRYTLKVSLPDDFVALCWAEFCRRFKPTGSDSLRKYKDWRRAFLKYVENNYFGLWAIDQSGQYFLTTKGKQAEKYQEATE